MIPTLPGVAAPSGETRTLFSWLATTFFKRQDKGLADIFLLVFATEVICSSNYLYIKHVYNNSVFEHMQYFPNPGKTIYG